MSNFSLNRRARRRNGKADFAPLAAEIEKALRARNSMRCVYEQHRNKLGFGYVQFTRYVKEFIGCPARLARPATTAASAPMAPGQPRAPAAAMPRQAPGAGTRRFQFDPMSVDRKDLV